MNEYLDEEIRVMFIVYALGSIDGNKTESETNRKSVRKVPEVPCSNFPFSPDVPLPLPSKWSARLC